MRLAPRKQTEGSHRPSIRSSARAPRAGIGGQISRAAERPEFARGVPLCLASAQLSRCRLLIKPVGIDRVVLLIQLAPLVGGESAAIDMARDCAGRFRFSEAPRSCAQVVTHLLTDSHSTSVQHGVLHGGACCYHLEALSTGS